MCMTGTMAQHVKLLQRAQVQFQEPAWWLTSIQNSSSRGSSSLFWPPQAPGTHTHTHTHTHTAGCVCEIPNFTKERTRDSADTAKELAIGKKHVSYYQTDGTSEPEEGQKQ